MPIPTDLNRRHRETLERIFHPVRRKAPGVAWNELLALLRALGCEIDEKRSGSRVSIRFPGGSVASMHRPHGRELDGGATAYIRKWLIENGIAPEAQ